ncbi:MAG: trypsin-like peptidase domain-containing protein [Clostridia bacterium]|nr:trypsin-like peptidase domain-containing protein [Clostridia bacterium]
MEEYKFNSESNYSEHGERNSATPITVAFKNISTEPPKKKSGAKRALLGLCALILVVGVSFAGGMAGAYVINNRMVPDMFDEFENSYLEKSPANDAVKDVLNAQNAPIETTATNTASVPEGSATYVGVATSAKPAVVEITTEMVSNNSYFQQFIQSGAGSGVIISDTGYIITNHHVIDGASKITVRLTDSSEYVATLIGSDSQADIAILKVDAEKALPYAKIGDSSKLIVGEEVIAIGNPLGSLGGSVTNGIISALDRELTIDGQKMRLLQTNAAINPGNSGGGLFNMKGELVAIVNAKSAGTGIEGLGFAIPINYAYDIAQELLENGYVSGRPAIGISYIEINDYMDLMRYGVMSYGIYVYDGGETPLKNGDRIVRFGDYEVQDSATLKSAIQNYKVGDKVNVTVARGGTFTDLEVTLIEDKPIEENKLELTN